MKKKQKLFKCDFKGLEQSNRLLQLSISPGINIVKYSGFKSKMANVQRCVGEKKPHIFIIFIPADTDNQCNRLDYSRPLIYVLTMYVYHMRSMCFTIFLKVEPPFFYSNPDNFTIFIPASIKHRPNRQGYSRRFI